MNSKCAQCLSLLTLRLSGKGRQQELCANCFKDNRRKNQLRQDERKRNRKKAHETIPSP